MLEPDRSSFHMEPVGERAIYQLVFVWVNKLFLEDFFFWPHQLAESCRPPISKQGSTCGAQRMDLPTVHEYVLLTCYSAPLYERQAIARAIITTWRPTFPEEKHTPDGRKIFVREVKEIARQFFVHMYALLPVQGVGCQWSFSCFGLKHEIN